LTRNVAVPIVVESSTLVNVASIFLLIVTPVIPAAEAVALDRQIGDYLLTMNAADEAEPDDRSDQQTEAALVQAQADVDQARAALAQAQARLAPDTDAVTWIEADITQVDLPASYYDVWHDRAVFHFLTDVSDRAKYINTVRHSLKPGGHIIVACFATDGPEQCSGLTVARYSPEALHDEFGEGFEVVASRRENHQTPFGTQQKFIYCYCRRR